MRYLSRFSVTNSSVYLLFVLALMFFLPGTQAATPGLQTFDHMSTGFALTGLHGRIDCESCHISGVFKGTPRQCRGCHARGTRISATLPPEDTVHLMSQQLECSNCHKTAGWTAAIFEHMGINSNCLRCHTAGGGGRSAPNDLVHAQLMGADCSVCHRSTRSFTSATLLDHSGITSGCEASGCHANDKARARGHASLIGCQNCHSYPSWNNVRMDHNTIGATQCRACHISGGNAMAAPADQVHISVAGSQDCSVCHTSTTTFTGGTIDHSLITTGCGVSGCHAADKATAPSHTSLNSCESCHRYPSWTSVTMNHNAVGATQCKRCHVAGGIATTSAPADPIHAGIGSQDCSVCHSSTTFVGAKVDHAFIVTGCATSGCHAADKVSAPNHTGLNSCESCHRYPSWTSMTMNHNAIGATQCKSCHVSGSIATTVAPTDQVHANIGTQDCSVCHTNTTTFAGAAVDHSLIVTGCGVSGCHATDKTTAPNHTNLNSCESCHRYPSWTSMTMNHNAVGTTQCKSCHVAGGIATTSAPADPLHATIGAQDCSECHTTTTTFVGAKIDHSLIVTGCAASGCHAADKATAPNHTSLNSCESCHRYPSWPSVTMNHNAVGTTQCKSCHRAGGIATTSAPADPLHATIGAQDCSVCHTNTTTFTGAKIDHSLIVTGCGASACHAADKATAPNHTSLNSCESCHRYPSWPSVTMNHSAVGATQCKSCHVAGGIATTTAPADALHAGIGSQDCSNCHSTSTFVGARVDHAFITTGCATSGCHAADKASAPNHTSLNSCELCHRYPVWPSVIMNHNAIGATQCKSCHVAGGLATTRAPADQIHAAIGTQDCSACHTTTTFVGAGVDHSTITSGCNNAGCHASDQASAPSPHATLNSCQSCHRYPSWPNVNMDHNGTGSTRCDACHLYFSNSGLGEGAPNDSRHRDAQSAGRDCNSCHNTRNFD